MSKDEMIILIVDDVEMNRSILATMVEGDYPVIEAENGDEALEILKKHTKRIALMFLDIFMPGSDGFAVLEEMNRQGWIKYIPVIMVSSDESPEYVERAFALGAVDYMPRLSASVVTKKRLTNTIEYALLQRSLLQKEQEKTEELRLKDSLTGAYSLEGFREQVRRIINEEPDREYLLWYGDIKNFKFVNTKYGYTEADELLRYMYKTTLAMMPEGGIVCRISADRMAGFCRFETDFDKSSRLRNEFKEFVREKFPSAMPDIYVGVYLLGAEDIKTIDVDAMIGKAQMAQQTIKANPEGGQALYDTKQWEKKTRILDICGHIDKAIENGEISIWIQPQIDYSTKKVVGGEALCRWNHKKLGNISPAEFIPVLEEAKLITKLDYFVWKQACVCMNAWKKAGRQIPIAVNVSRVDILEADVPKMLTELINEYELTPDMLRIEITENVYMEKAEVLKKTVEELQRIGFTVEMDDFGSGFSSLNILRNIPLDVLKLDLGFLRGKGEENYSIKSGNIISAIVRMAYGMDMPIIAEGVETSQQADFLRGLGCNLMQGYLFSKPLPVNEFEEYLNKKDIAELPTALNGDNMSPVQELFDSDSSSSYIFNYCIGAAALIEYDGDKLDIIIHNEEFMHILGYAMQDIETHNLNFFDALHPSDKKLCQETVEDAVRLGYASCEMLSPFSKKWIAYDFRHVSDGVNCSLLSCMIKDATNEYNLRHEVGAVAVGDNFKETEQDNQEESTSQTGDYHRIKGLKASTFNAGMAVITSIIMIILLLNNAELVQGVYCEVNSVATRQFIFLLLLLADIFVIIIVNKRFVLNPLSRYVDCIKNERKLDDIGSYEFKQLASIYNHMYETNIASKEILQYASEHDNLTGVLNRRAYDALTKIYRLNHAKFGLIITDADKFKDINDNYGHDVGDQILKKIAFLLQNSFRSNDKIIRYGGDEFVIILSEMQKENSYIVDRKISEINEKLQNPDDGLPPISISAGFAFSEDGYNEEVFKLADKRLYQAKSSGRCNCKYAD